MKFHQALALIFICLKLVGEIDWSWWWVLSPFWIVFVLAVIPTASRGACPAVVAKWN